MKDKAIQWFLGLLMCVSCIGCDDFLTQEPINAVTNQNYWETEKDARIAMNGLLSSFRDARGDVVVMYRDRGWPVAVPIHILLSSFSMMAVTECSPW